MPSFPWLRISSLIILEALESSIPFLFYLSVYGCIIRRYAVTMVTIL
jgi:hypothetical protein